MGVNWKKKQIDQKFLSKSQFQNFYVPNEKVKKSASKEIFVDIFTDPESQENCFN